MGTEDAPDDDARPVLDPAALELPAAGTLLDGTALLLELDEEALELADRPGPTNDSTP
jgi:hypothetical protein